MSADRMIIPGDLPGENPPPARQIPPPPHVKPRTWSLPPEPGPEVTAIRAAQTLYGRTLWRRANRSDLGRHWELRREDGALLTTVVSWLRLLERFGPLTDATETQDGDRG